MNEDVNILGGGISGLACAIILRKNGHDVNVYEKRSSIGARFNGDWQGLENWSEKIDVLEQIRSYGIDTSSFDYTSLSKLDIHYSNKVRTLQQKNACYFLKRGNCEECLDTNLCEQAQKLGVNIHFNSSPDESTPIHVNATGPKNKQILAKGIKFTTKHEDVYKMGFGSEFAKGFYSYLVIRDGHGTISTVFHHEDAQHSNKYLQNTVDYFSKYLDKGDLETGHKFGGYGAFEIKDSFYDENGAMLVGEAAGFQDYLWGFGMRYAFQSGYFAARSIMYGESYSDLIKDNLLQKMRHSKRNRSIFETMGPLAYPLAYYALSSTKKPLKLLNLIYR